MADHEIKRASTNEGLPVGTAMGPTLEAADVPSSYCEQLGSVNPAGLASYWWSLR